jgi:predicted nucleic acid-binding protein
MANELILLDTSVLIDYFRKKDKRKSYLARLAARVDLKFAISVITEFEILVGSNSEQQDFWEALFSNFTVLHLDSMCIRQAVKVQKILKRENQMIAIPDLLIAATAMEHDLQIATQNISHFKRIDQLQIFEEA